MNKLTNRKIDRAKKYALAGITFTGAVAATGPLALLAQVPLYMACVNYTSKAVKNYYIDNSMMVADSKGKIGQILPNIKQLLTLACLKNDNERTNFLNIQEMNFFLGADIVDKKGDPIKYTTTSHAITYKNLKKLEKDGYITNLSREERKKEKNFFLEKLMLGNFKGAFSGKKSKAYDISFNKTDKVMDEEYIKKTLGADDQKLSTMYEIKRDDVTGQIVNINYNVSELMKEKFGSVKDRIKTIKLPERERFISKLKNYTISESQHINASQREVDLTKNMEKADETVR